MSKGMMRTAGVLLVASLVLLMASIGFAAEDFNRWGVGMHALYINPDADTTDALGHIDVEPNVTAGITIEYFFTPNISTELVAAVSKHDIEIDNDVYGSLWLLPPSLYVKYHPVPQWKISPYVGVGVNWVYAWDEKLDVGTTLEVEDSFGWAAKVGADIRVTDNLFLNVDIMYLNVETELNLKGVVKGVDLDVDPWVYSLGAKYRF